MGKPFDNFSARIKRWETFFHQFIDYVFHTQAGRRIRWQFLRQTLLRTVTYTLGGVVVIIILWCYHLFHGDSAAVNVTLAVLILDFAFGAAVLRTMDTYRYRVQTFLKWDNEGQSSAEELKQDVNPGAREAVEDIDLPGSDGETEDMTIVNDAAPEPQIPEVARRLFKCKRCGRRITMPAEEPLVDIQCSCGGKMRAV